MRIYVVALLLTAVLGGGLYGYSHYQGIDKARQERLGRQCSERLAAIHEACQRLALSTHAGARQPWPEGGPAAALNPLLEGFTLQEGCPAGGAYRLPDRLTDDAGGLLPPSCPHETEKLGKSEPSFHDQGLHTCPQESPRVRVTSK